MIKIDPNVNVVAVPTEMVGKKLKYKIEIDGKLYIIKQNAMNYEIYAELIAEKLGKQVGIEMAHYNICEFNNKIGLITPVFLNKENEELIISVKALLEHAKDLCTENNIKFDLRENTVENILKAASLFDKRVNIKKLADELVRRWIFYGMIMESDKNNTNLSFIKDKQASIRISPDYDNSTMARLNENIDELLNDLRRGTDIFSITDRTKTALKIKSNPSDEFMTNYRSFIEEFGIYYERIIEEFISLDVDRAIAEVEIENDIEIPYNVKFWLRKAINTRKDDMFNILNNKLENKISKKH